MANHWEMYEFIRMMEQGFARGGTGPFYNSGRRGYGGDASDSFRYGFSGYRWNTTQDPRTQHTPPPMEPKPEATWKKDLGTVIDLIRVSPIDYDPMKSKETPYYWPEYLKAWIGGEILACEVQDWLILELLKADSRPVEDLLVEFVDAAPGWMDFRDTRTGEVRRFSREIDLYAIRRWAQRQGHRCTLLALFILKARPKNGMALARRFR